MTDRRISSLPLLHVCRDFSSPAISYLTRSLSLSLSLSLSPFVYLCLYVCLCLCASSPIHTEMTACRYIHTQTQRRTFFSLSHYSLSECFTRSHGHFCGMHVHTCTRLVVTVSVTNSFMLVLFVLSRTVFWPPDGFVFLSNGGGSCVGI